VRTIALRLLTSFDMKRQLLDLRWTRLVGADTYEQGQGPSRVDHGESCAGPTLAETTCKILPDDSG